MRGARESYLSHIPFTFSLWIRLLVLALRMAIYFINVRLRGKYIISAGWWKKHMKAGYSLLTSVFTGDVELGW